MKRMYWIAACASMASLLSCRQPVAPATEYVAFLNKAAYQKKIDANDAEINFWQQKWLTDTGSYVNQYEMAQHLIARFHLSANATDLGLADALLQNCVVKTGRKEPGLYYTLIQNAILQHKFKEAGQWLDSLTRLGGDPFIVQLLSFDVHVELGNYNQASFALQKLGNKPQNFQYLIRHAKLLDAKGKTQEALQQMENAYRVALQKGNPSAINWSLTNMADMYSHEGNIKKAYQYYLQALRRDSSNLYALKGIAKICYLTDQNHAQANTIVQFAKQMAYRPEDELLLAEIAESAGNKTDQEKYEQLFMQSLTRQPYGNMYHKYMIEQWLSKDASKKAALQLAQQEILNRATPETFTLLAYALYQNGKETEAINLVKEKVLGNTFEPDLLLMAGIILNKTETEKSKQCLQQCLQSSFELGPAKYKMVQSLLNG